ncbi:unnamed protein product, partial [Sphagnum troendelagicum]
MSGTNLTHIIRCKILPFICVRFVPLLGVGLRALRLLHLVIYICLGFSRSVDFCTPRSGSSSSPVAIL